jgi:hypothetical protein
VKTAPFVFSEVKVPFFDTKKPVANKRKGVFCWTFEKMQFADLLDCRQAAQTTKSMACKGDWL